MSVYYVSITGNDSYNGSITGNWRTIQKAANSLVSGDIARVYTGLFEEKVYISGNGGTFISHNGGSKVRGFSLDNTNNNNIIGFELTHQDNTGAYQYIAITINNSTGIQILDNWIHHTDNGGISIGASQNITIRDNKLEYIFYPGYPLFSGSNAAGAIAGVFNNPASGILIEYNKISYASDFLNPFGGNWVIRNNLLGPSDTGAVAHIDFIQNNGILTRSVIENNWHENNISSDNHFFLNQISGADHNIIRGNVSYYSKAGFDIRACCYQYIYNNTFAINYPYNTNSFQILVSEYSSGNIARNNIWYQSNTNNGGSNPYLTSDISTISTNSDCRYLAGGASSINDVLLDPLFVNTSGGNIILQNISPVIGSGGYIAIITGNVINNNQIMIDTTGINMLYTGDFIQINTGYLYKITGINYSSNTLFMDENISCNINDFIYWNGNRDIGALPYKSYSYSIIANYINNNNLYQINVNYPNLIRQVIYFNDNIPVYTATEYPYLYNGTGNITAKVYPFYASKTLSSSINKFNLICNMGDF